MQAAKPWIFGFSFVAVFILSFAGPIIAKRLGPTSPEAASFRLRQAILAALVLNFVAIPAPVSGYSTLLSLPLAFFGISTTVAAITGRAPLMVGPLASIWFLIPSRIHWWFTASPDQIAAYGRIPFDPFTGFSFVASFVGSAWVAWVWHRGSHPARALR